MNGFSRYQRSMSLMVLTSETISNLDQGLVLTSPSSGATVDADGEAGAAAVVGGGVSGSASSSSTAAASSSAATSVGGVFSTPKNAPLRVRKSSVRIRHATKMRTEQVVEEVTNFKHSLNC